MSDDGHGAIKNISKARGIKGALGQMVETCRKHTEGLAAASQRLVISYCNCPERASGARHDPREVPGHRRNHHDPDLRALADVRQRRRHRHRVLSDPFASKRLFSSVRKRVFSRNMGVFSDNLRLLQSASLTDLRRSACLQSRTAGGKLHALKEGALWGAILRCFFLQNVLSFVIIYLPLRGRWHDEVVTEGVPAGGGRSCPKS